MNGMKAKALVWRARNELYEGRVHYGKGAFEHWYAVSRERAGEWRVMHHVGGSVIHLGPCRTMDEAKSAAQADYEARILSALERVE